MMKNLFKINLFALLFTATLMISVTSCDGDVTTTSLVGNQDSDDDGVVDSQDACANTPTGETVDTNGCSNSQKDSDGDEIFDDIDECPNTPIGEDVDEKGCADSQIDTDGDEIMDDKDLCINTPEAEIGNVNDNGCAPSELDSDGDGIKDDKDLCPDTPEAEKENVDDNGCAVSQLDDDNDGITNDKDLCPSTPEGTSVNANGCASTGVSIANVPALSKGTSTCIGPFCFEKEGSLLGELFGGSNAIPLDLTDSTKDVLDIFDEDKNGFVIKEDGTYTVASMIRLHSLTLDITRIFSLLGIDLGAGTPIEIVKTPASGSEQVLTTFKVKNNIISLGGFIVPTTGSYSGEYTLVAGDTVSIRFPENFLSILQRFDWSFLQLSTGIVSSESYLSIERK